MFTVEPRITVNQLLQALLSDGIYLFLGAAFGVERSQFSGAEVGF